MAQDRIVVPKGGHAPPERATREEIGAERLLTALQRMDANAADRMKDLRIFLFVLPIIWGVIWGVLYFFFLVLRTS